MKVNTGELCICLFVTTYINLCLTNHIKITKPVNYNTILHRVTTYVRIT